MPDPHDIPRKQALIAAQRGFLITQRIKAADDLEKIAIKAVRDSAKSRAIAEYLQIAPDETIMQIFEANRKHDECKKLAGMEVEGKAN